MVLNAGHYGLLLLDRVEHVSPAAALPLLRAVQSFVPVPLSSMVKSVLCDSLSHNGVHRKIGRAAWT